jgi:hypothetical protein
MLTIGKYARALPSLLDLKERGTGPREFSEQVVGTVDLSQLYLLQGREVLVSAVNAAPAVGANFFVPATIVPPGEIWYVWEYAVSSTPGAGAAIDMAPAAQIDGAALFPLAPYQAAAATQNVRVPSTHVVVATPGTEFGFLVRSVTLAPSVNAVLLVTKLKL